MMRKTILLTFMMMVAIVGFAKEIKTLRVTTDPQMVCNNCENKIKKTLRFEKGIQDITTDLEGQVVTVVYDAEKTDEAKIVKAFENMKYKAQVLGDDCESPAKEVCHKAEGQCDKAKKECCKKAEGQCDKAKKECCKKAEGQCDKAKKEGCKKAEGQCDKAKEECCKKAEKK